MNVTSPEQAFRILGRQDLLEKQAFDREDYSFQGRSATFCSFVRAHVKQASYEVRSKCADYAHFWGIEGECREALDKLAAYEPPEIPADDWALNQGGLKKFAAYDQRSTFEAAVAFVSQRPQMPLAWRKTAATKLLSRAQKFETNLPAYVDQALHKSAGLGFPTAESVEEALVCRLNQVKDQELSEKLAEALEPMIDDQQLRYDPEQVKLAIDALEAFDAGTGLTDHYGQGLDLPEQILGTTAADLEKIADYPRLEVDLVNGRSVQVDQLSKEALAAIDPGLAKLGQEELIGVLPTLPKEDADLLTRLA